MIAILSWSYRALVCLCVARRRSSTAFALAMVLIVCAAASAQTATTTISGAVYDPRTTSSALPLPNVLVYATTGTVAALPSGVQCLTYQSPTGAVSYTYTAVDGTFTLANIPQGDTYTVVIQAGKWRRQFPSQVGTTPVTGLALHMPANHTQGDIPMIAVVTGWVDAAECVLRDMGIADSEFTDDTQTGNPGHIHLYQGGGAPGAEISASTPEESALTGNPTVLNGYDMVMFPCQGGEFDQPSAPLTNIVNYANAGGRLFTTHYSYVYLDSDPPINAQFPPVANWDPQQANPLPDPGIATVNTNFSDGATLAQWLENSGATVTGTSDEIQISNLKHDMDGVIAPTQNWLTLYNPAVGDPVMQMTFNTPVGAPAAGQCGRVMFNEYHVINPTGTRVYPGECPTLTNGIMSAQEEVLEYALFDLSNFVQPVATPSLSITFNLSPLVVKSGDTGDQVTVSVTDNSTTTATDSSAILTFTLPPNVTLTAMTDSAGGWICTVNTASCSRNSSLPASTTDSVTLTLNVATYTTLPSYTGTLTATVSSVTFSNLTATDTVIFSQVPAINWATPAPITYGTPLSSVQLDATTTVAGSFTYSPSVGAVLPAGRQTLTAAFTPYDTVHYTSATATVTLTVLPATLVITLTSSANPVFLTSSVTFTASVSALPIMPTGTITFMDGGRQLGTVAIDSGTASIITSVLAAGVHSITAVYSGDSIYATATSATLAENIEDFTLTVSGPSGANVKGGGTATYTLVVTPVGGATLPAAVSLSASGIPLAATATFSPATVGANSAATTVTLEVKMPGSAGLERPRGLFGGGGIPVALGLFLLPFAGRLRRRVGRWCVLILLAVSAAVLAAGINGCGSLRPESFSLNVTAASGGLSHSTAVEITVQ